MSVDELRNMLEENMNLHTLLNEIEYWFSSHAIIECYEDIAKQWDIELENEED